MIDSYEWEVRFRKAVKKGKMKKRFKKALAGRLGVKYSEIKSLFPVSLNSTLIANYLNPHLTFYTHEEIRSVVFQAQHSFRSCRLIL